jgi:hypothetical protein
MGSTGFSDGCRPLFLFGIKELGAEIFENISAEAETNGTVERFHPAVFPDNWIGEFPQKIPSRFFEPNFPAPVFPVNEPWKKIE